VYDELAGRGEEPLRSTLAHANALPATFELARRIGDFGSPVDTVTFRGDEADFVLISGTRITYVLGEEEQSITDLVSALPNLDLSTGLVEYVDLRFPGKVYLKRVGE
jgi:hypothetical protein